MRLAIVKRRSLVFGGPTVPVIERLESRTLLSATAHPAATPAAIHAKTNFAISDILGAAAMAIWQNGQAVLPGTGGPVSSSASASPSVASPAAGTANGTLLGTATLGAPAIFSLLPVLPPDGLAAAIVGMIDPSHSSNVGVFNSNYGTIGDAGSRSGNV
jgi:hypothetical protein